MACESAETLPCSCPSCAEYDNIPHMNNKPLIFVSDVHLSSSRQEITACFIRFLEKWKNKTTGLYILGDFFDFWIGDDTLDDFSLTIINALKQFTSCGTPCYFIHGNRDFLIGDTFFQLSGIQPLPDPSVIEYQHKKYLVTHGDYLCIDDAKYQKFRRFMVANKKNQRRLLALPRWLRIIIKDFARKKSLSHQKALKQSIDINRRYTLEECRKHSTNRIIHGHTHRPIIDEFNSQPPVTRITLPAWDNAGGYLKINTNGELSLHEL